MVRLSATLATTFACLALAGCCDIKIPAGTLGQFANPERARDRISADVCYEFPKCTFADPQEEQDFKEIVRAINEIGAALRPALKKGEITAEEFVAYEVILEFFAAELLNWCENSPAPLNEPAKTVLLTYAERLGMKREIEHLGTTPRGDRLAALSRLVGAVKGNVKGGGK